ncbi:MAG: hypothetical protein KA270_02805 [Saprospiraceae bacterium]|nr:hypothetical protein [Saprospiraceae bacterium]
MRTLDSRLKDCELIIKETSAMMATYDNLARAFFEKDTDRQIVLKTQSKLQKQKIKQMISEYNKSKESNLG